MAAQNLIINVLTIPNKITAVGSISGTLQLYFMNFTDKILSSQFKNEQKLPEKNKLRPPFV
jgi:hypothetical protein